MRSIKALAIGLFLTLGGLTGAFAQCGTTAPANKYCGNDTGSPALANWKTIPTGALTPIAGGTVIGNPTGALAAPIATSTPVLGIPGTTLGSLGFGNLTTGTVTLRPVTGALGSSVLSIPAITDTIAGFALANGGTNNSLTASNGGIVYSDSTKLNVLAGTATARQMLQSGASAAPTWSTAIWPATTTINQILYSSSANTVAGLATANSSILVTDSGGIPSLSTTLPAHTTTTSETVPLVIGGTGAASTLTLESTSGVGTTDAIIGKTGSQVERFRVTTGGQFNIGPAVAPAAGALLTLNQNTGTPAAGFISNPALHAVAADGAVNSLVLDSYASQSFITGRASAGTQASKTALAATSLSTSYGGQGWDTAAYFTMATMDIIASATQSPTDHSGNIIWRTVAGSSTSLTEKMRLNASGGLSVNSTAQDPGAGVISAQTGYRVNNAATSGNVLRGNGTNFISAQLACSDLSGVGTGCSAAAGITALTGDATATGPGSVALTLATVASAGTTGSSTAIPVITINAKGLTTNITTAAVVAPAGTLTGATLAAGVTASSLTSLGTITSLTATTINAFTLGGTISGGGNQLNNIIIGTSTPLAGSFTTLSASTSVTSPLHYGGSAAGSTHLVNGTSNGSPASAFVNIQSNGQFTSIGNTSPKTYLDINENLSSSPALVTSTGLVRIQAADTANGGMEWVAYNPASGNLLNGVVAGGTSASPAATPSAMNLFNLRGYAHNGTTFQIGAIITMVTDSLWSGSNQATRLDFYTTATGSTTVTRQMVLQPSGGLSLGNAVVSTDPGAGGVIANGATIRLTALASTAQTNVVCYNTGTGLLTTQSFATGCTVSAARFKNIASVISPEEGFSVMTQAIGYRYTYKKEVDLGSDVHFGFTADQMATIDRDLVTFEKDGQTHSVKYQELWAFAAGAFRKLKADNDNLRSDIESLKKASHR